MSKNLTKAKMIEELEQEFWRNHHNKDGMCCGLMEELARLRRLLKSEVEYEYALLEEALTGRSSDE